MGLQTLYFSNITHNMQASSNLFTIWHWIN